MQLVDKYCPTTFSEFAGIERPRALLQAFVRNPYSSAWLLLGPSGIGKTTIAFTTAYALGATKEIGGGIYHIPARKCDLETIDMTVQQCHQRPLYGGPWNAVIIDEADKMTPAAQLALLSVLDGTAPPPDTVFLLTCNDLAALEERFKSRCRLLTFKTDSMLTPGIALLKRIWKAETKAMKKAPAPPDFAAILKTSLFNLRSAMMLLETELLSPGSLADTIETSEEIGEDAGTVYTIGCVGYSANAIVAIVKTLAIDVVLDCCVKPRRSLKAVLEGKYQFRGDELSCHKVAPAAQEHGLKRIVELARDGQSVLLLYQEEAPGECKRHGTIALDLLRRGIDCTHIYANQLIKAGELQASIDGDRKYEYEEWRRPRAVA